MKAKTPLLLVALLGTLFIGSAAAADIALAACPAPVQATIRNSDQGGRLDDIKSVTVNGRTLYVVEFDLAGNRDLKLHITSDGTIVKSREELTMAQLPAAVRLAAEKMVPAGGKVDDIDKEVADGRTTYLVEIDRPNTNDLKIVFSEDGSVISQRGE